MFKHCQGAALHHLGSASLCIFFHSHAVYVELHSDNTDKMKLFSYHAYFGHSDNGLSEPAEPFQHKQMDSLSLKCIFAFTG